MTLHPTYHSAFEALLAAIPGTADWPADDVAKTVRRAASAWKDELLAGYAVDPRTFLETQFELELGQSNQLVMLTQIPVYSTCEHHLLPFVGTARVAYIPGQCVTGLSKLVRVVDGYARRLQVQERLTTQIADALDHCLRPQGVGVMLQCEHMCMTIRGAQAPGTLTTTIQLKGGLLHEPFHSQFVAP
ncbi:MAG TPA: GTP cyclohydrolase I [Bacillota bacterium]|nr:GTP cyclohydrolase I [Dermatophilaceae bacterium]HOI35793.1 GTP cyclohydrolase I [Bacillota bacterium]